MQAFYSFEKNIKDTRLTKAEITPCIVKIDWNRTCLRYLKNFLNDFLQIKTFITQV